MRVWRLGQEWYQEERRGLRSGFGSKLERAKAAWGQTWCRVRDPSWTGNVCHLGRPHVQIVSHGEVVAIGKEGVGGRAHLLQSPLLRLGTHGSHEVGAHERVILLRLAKANAPAGWEGG